MIFQESFLSSYCFIADVCKSFAIIKIYIWSSQTRFHNHMPTTTREPPVPMKLQSCELSPCLLSTVLGHREDEELICSSWSFLGTSTISPTETLHPVRTTAMWGPHILCDTRPEPEKGTATALQNLGYYYRDKVTELESSLEDAEQKGYSVLAHWCGLLEPGDALATLNGSRGWWPWLFLMPVLATVAVVTNDDIQVNHIHEPLIQTFDSNLLMRLHVQAHKNFRYTRYTVSPLSACFQGSVVQPQVR